MRNRKFVGECLSFLKLLMHIVYFQIDQLSLFCFNLTDFSAKIYKMAAVVRFAKSELAAKATAMARFLRHHAVRYYDVLNSNIFSNSHSRTCSRQFGSSLSLNVMIQPQPLNYSKTTQRPFPNLGLGPGSRLDSVCQNRCFHLERRRSCVS